MTFNDILQKNPRLNISLVDDEFAQLILLRMLLEQQDYIVVTAANGKEA